jgi:hypothetical protein
MELTGDGLRDVARQMLARLAEELELPDDALDLPPVSGFELIERRRQEMLAVLNERAPEVADELTRDVLHPMLREAGVADPERYRLEWSVE